MSNPKLNSRLYPRGKHMQKKKVCNYSHNDHQRRLCAQSDFTKHGFSCSRDLQQPQVCALSTGKSYTSDTRRL